MKNHELIRKTCEDLYLMTGIRAVLYDENMQIIYSHPNTMGSFCRKVRRDTELSRKCLECDRKGFEECRRLGALNIYHCHMGLTEASAPIMDSGVVVGYLLFGQELCEGDRESVLRHIDEMDRLENREEMKSDVMNMKPTSVGKLQAAARMLSMCACYIRMNNILTVQQENLAVHIARYVQEHLGEEGLGIERLCGQFGISRGTLYTICKHSLGMGVTEYIREERLRRAQELLRDTDLPVNCVAEQCGFEDPDYLSRLLRKQMGLSARAYRKKRNP